MTTPAAMLSPEQLDRAGRELFAVHYAINHHPVFHEPLDDCGTAAVEAVARRDWINLEPVVRATWGELARQIIEAAT